MVKPHNEHADRRGEGGSSSITSPLPPAAAAAGCAGGRGGGSCTSHSSLTSPLPPAAAAAGRGGGRGGGSGTSHSSALPWQRSVDAMPPLPLQELEELAAVSAGGGKGLPVFFRGNGSAARGADIVAHGGDGGGSGMFDADGDPAADGVPDLLSRDHWRGRPLRWWLSGAFWPGAKLPQLLLCVAVGLVLALAVPTPRGLAHSPEGWTLFSIFLATILGLILQPLPMAGVVLLSASICLWAGVLTFAEATEGFTEATPWLISGALLMAQAVDKSGLGRRVSLSFIAMFGGTPLRLTYALMFADLVLALGMPSTTAREGGVFLPIIRGISRAYGSHPSPPDSAALLGAFLMMAQLQHTQPTSAMWYTGSAPNALAIGLARQLGVEMPAGDWVTWVRGSWLPSLVIMLVTPVAVLWLYPPRVRATPSAPKAARRALQESGRLEFGEAVTLLVLVFAVAFWVAGGYLHPKLSPTAVVFMAVSLLLIAGVLRWEDCLACTLAWDTLVWLSLMMSLSAALTTRGVVGWIADRVARALERSGMPPAGIFVLLLVVYVLPLHYIFASQSAHVAALYSPFLAVMLRLKFSPLLSAMSLAYVGNALTGMTHYASAESVIYYAQRYYGVRAVFGVGFVLTVLNLALWIGLGLGWWKVCGFYSDISTMQ